MKTPSTFRNAAGFLAITVAALVVVGDVSTRGTLVLGGRPAHAVVGRPLTPVSYAGVARRTSRRTTRRNVAYGSGGYYGAAPAGVIYTLPAGCALSGGIYVCGTVRYRPYYDGPTVVYQPI
jgi:hypothetical protein